MRPRDRAALPAAVGRFLGDAILERDRVGESPASVYRFTRGADTFYLKTVATRYADTTFSVWREGQVLEWLAPRLAVPEVVVLERTTELECLVMRAVPGTSLSTLIAQERPVVPCFAEAIRLLQGIDASGCPLRSDVSVRLEELERLVADGLLADDVDLSRWPGLATPSDLLHHLIRTAPREELVLSHGDLCDSNVFIDDRDVLHFIDWGRGGIADRWIDIAFAHRNLRDDVSDDAAAQFLRALPYPDAPEKRLYFELLDELF